MPPALTALPNVSSPCPVGWCETHPLGDLPSFVKCWPPEYPCAYPGIVVPAPPATPVPTLSEWGLLALALALVIVGLRRLL